MMTDWATLFTSLGPLALAESDTLQSMVSVSFQTFKFHRLTQPRFGLWAEIQFIGRLSNLCSMTVYGSEFKWVISHSPVKDSVLAFSDLYALTDGFIIDNRVQLSFNLTKKWRPE